MLLLFFLKVIPFPVSYCDNWLVCVSRGHGNAGGRMEVTSFLVTLFRDLIGTIITDGRKRFAVIRGTDNTSVLFSH